MSARPKDEGGERGHRIDVTPEWLRELRQTWATLKKTPTEDGTKRTLENEAIRIGVSDSALHRAVGGDDETKNVVTSRVAEAAVQHWGMPPPESPVATREHLRWIEAGLVLLRLRPADFDRLLSAAERLAASADLQAHDEDVRRSIDDLAESAAVTEELAMSGRTPPPRKTSFGPRKRS